MIRSVFKTRSSKSKTANIAGLQLADILAYPIKQDILFEEGRIEKVKGNFSEKLCKVAESKYNRHEFRMQIIGYGKIFLK